MQNTMNKYKSDQYKIYSLSDSILFKEKDYYDLEIQCEIANESKRKQDDEDDEDYYRESERGARNV